MTQAEFEQEVCLATGEDRRTVRTRGFSLVVMPDREPLTVDWDTVQQVEPIRYRLHRRRRRCAA
ncbi:MAG: hypothetical protein C0483_07540 [Pirellula sp.]|nr:hypothetical protein [Pirellula sp.]